MTTPPQQPQPPKPHRVTWVDAASRRYYLADRSNSAVDVVDTTENAVVKQITGFKGFTGNIGAMACYAGQSVGEVRGVQPAGEIVAELVDQAEKLLKGTAKATSV